jgi:phosphoadenosine phosphosulfate reductase
VNAADARPTWLGLPQPGTTEAPVQAPPTAPPSELERLARSAARDLAGAPARDVIAWAAKTFGRRLCITSSMTDAVIIHLASQQVPDIDVLFLDTGYHFAETIGTRDAVSAVYPVNVINVTPPTTVAEQDAELGPKLYSRNPDLCCYLRKVVPLEQALGPYDAWITGVRRDETEARSDTGAVMWDPRREMIKVNPIVEWSTTTSRPTGCWSTRSSSRVTRRSAARPAPSASRTAPTRGAAAGRGPARPSAACTPEPGPGPGPDRPA